MDFETQVMEKLAELDARLRRVEEALPAQKEGEAPTKTPQRKPKELVTEATLGDWDRGK